MPLVTPDDFPLTALYYSTNEIRFEGEAPGSPQWYYFCFDDVYLENAGPWAVAFYYTNLDNNNATNYIQFCTGSGYVDGHFAYKIGPTDSNAFGQPLVAYDLSCSVCYSTIPTTTTTTTYLDCIECDNFIHPPEYINGVYITHLATGDVSVEPPGVYPNEICDTCILPEETYIRLGRDYPFTYTLYFSSPVNDIIVYLTGAGSVISPIEEENFIITTDDNIPTIITNASCLSRVESNIIYSGAGIEIGSSGGGGIFTIHSDIDYSSLKVEGDGGLYGAIAAFCAINIEPTTTTTTTIEPTTTTTTTAVPPECFLGMIIESFYIDRHSDLDDVLAQVGYFPPSGAELTKLQDSIGTHDCNYALYCVYGNDIYIGDSLMNNSDNTTTCLPATVTPDGNVCFSNYNNNIATIYNIELSNMSRYSYIRVSSEEAAEMSAASVDTTITFDFVEYRGAHDCPCTGHEFITWVIIRDSQFNILYNGVPNAQFVTLDVVCPEPTPGLGHYWRLLDCSDGWCYLSVDDKLTLEALLGPFEVGDRFYSEGGEYQEYLYEWEGILERFDTLPPTCVIHSLTRTLDTCES